MTTRVAAATSVPVTNSTLATEAIDASASPRNPSVPIALRSSALLIFGSLAESPLYAQEPALLTVPLYLVLSNKRTAEFAKVTTAFEKAVKSGEWARTVRAAFEAIRQRSAKP